MSFDAHCAQLHPPHTHTYTDTDAQLTTRRCCLYCPLPLSTMSCSLANSLLLSLLPAATLHVLRLRLLQVTFCLCLFVAFVLVVVVSFALSSRLRVSCVCVFFWVEEFQFQEIFKNIPWQ